MYIPPPETSSQLYQTGIHVSQDTQAKVMDRATHICFLIRIVLFEVLRVDSCCVHTLANVHPGGRLDVFAQL